MGFFEKIKQGLKKTRENISHKIDLVINSFTKIDEEFFEELEEILIASDISFQTSQKICENLRSEVKKHGYKDPKDIKIALRDMVEEIMSGNNDISMMQADLSLMPVPDISTGGHSCIHSHMKSC